jgi:hypothetical protein
VWLEIIKDFNMTVEVDYDKQLRRVDENQSFGRTAVLREQYWISLTGWGKQWFHRKPHFLLQQKTIKQQNKKY